MGKDVADLRGQELPVSRERRLPIAVASRVPAVIGKCAHPAEHSFGAAPYQPHFSIPLYPVSGAGAVRLDLLHGLHRIRFSCSRLPSGAMR